MGSEFKAIILSTWKIPCTLPGNCALCTFIFLLLLLLFVFVLFYFNAGGPCVQHISMVLSRLVLLVKDAVVIRQQTSLPLCYLLFSTWSVFFWYTFVFVIAATKCHNRWTFVFVFTTACSAPGWSTEAFYFLEACCVANLLTPEHKIQSPKLTAIYWT